jgi:hypothetical protein
MEMALPIGRDSTGRPRDGLVQGMVLGGGQVWPVVKLLALVVPEPAFSRLKASDNAVPGVASMLRGVLARRSVTTADMTTFGTTPQVEPPSFSGEALDAAAATRWRRRINSGLGHRLILLERNGRCRPHHLDHL